jgi:hypothetical protein
MLNSNHEVDISKTAAVRRPMSYISGGASMELRIACGGAEATPPPKLLKAF